VFDFVHSINKGNPLTRSSSLKKYIKTIPFAESSYKKINRFLNIFYRKEQIAMFHMGRCGSTVLGNMLNAHSKVFWDSEIFVKHMKYMQSEKSKEKKGFVERTIEWSCHRKVSRIYGFETKYLSQQHLSHKFINMDLEDYITLLLKLGFSKFIVLHRKNYLKRAISVQAGRQTKKWHSEQDATAPEKITIDINSFTTEDEIRQEHILDLFRCADESFNRLKKLLSHNDTLFLTYEDDILEDPRVAYKKVCDFLGVVDEAPKIELHRTNPFRYEDMVINFEKVKAVLKDTNYSWMLDD